MKTRIEIVKDKLRAARSMAGVLPEAAALAAGAIVEKECCPALHLDTEMQGESFFRWLRELEDHGVLDRTTAGRIHRLRINANRCRHEGEEPSEDEMIALLAEAEEAIEQITGMSFTTPCEDCGETIRVVVSRFYRQPGRGRRAVCPDCRTPVRVRFDEIHRVEVEEGAHA